MTNWIPDLRKYEGPRYLAIANAIADAIDAGELQPGMRLPTHRGLADCINVSVHTVSQAYAEAERRGHITGEKGRGTFVQGPRRDNVGNFIMDWRQGEVIDLSIIRPVIGSIHRERLQSTFAQLAEEPVFEPMLACRPVSGLDSHREAGAAWLSSMGVDASPSEVIVTNGTAHGLTVALATLTEPGDIVASEEMTDHGLIALSSVLHFRLKGLRTDEEGILPGSFEEACAAGPVRALVCTPTLANPSTATMSTQRREQIVDIARRYNVMLVENDVFRPLVERPPPPLWNMARERTCYLTSFTKAVVSGLRTGYLAAADPLIHRLAIRLRATSWMGNPLTAEIGSRWIEDGTIATLIDWQRRAVAERQAVMQSALGGHGLRTHSNALHAWLELPAGWRADNFVAVARLRRVALTTPTPFMLGRSVEPSAVRIGIGGPAGTADLRQALAVVQQVLAMGPEPLYLDM